MLILLVEDNELQQQMILSFLRTTEYEVNHAKNAFDAWEKANKEIPDLILLDIMMPGMTGLDLCSRFKSSKKFAHIPIIFLTALGNKENIINGLSLGASDYIAKPFDKEELMARIGVHLQLKLSNDIISAQNNSLKLELEKRKITEENFRIFFKAVNSSPIMVIITDEFGNIEYANPAFFTIKGYGVDEIIGKNLIENYGEIDMNKIENFKDIWKSVLKGNEWKGEVLGRKSDGTSIWQDLSVVPLSEDDRISRIVFLITDITEQHNYIEKINKYNDELNELIAVKDKFFTIIAHDLKNPLSILMSSSQIMTDPDFEFTIEEIKQFSKEISASSKNLYELLENLLTWARSQTGKIEYNPSINLLYDIANYSTAVLSTNAKAKKIEINIDIPKDVEVYCDVNMIATVFRNLVSNAIKFTPENGSITISLNKFLISEDNNRKYAQISIDDSGVGILEEDAEKLFRIDVKHTTLGTGKEKGTGLGLIVSKEFIDRHNGKIWVESQVGIGTKIKFTIPAEKESEPEIIL